MNVLYSECWYWLFDWMAVEEPGEVWLTFSGFYGKDSDEVLRRERELHVA